MKRNLLVTVLVALVGSLLLSAFSTARGDDWPMFGRDKTRNAVSPEKGPPIDWDVKTRRNIKWIARLGSNTRGDPVVVDGLVWVGTNNSRPPEFGFNDDASVLMCFRESDGKLLYRYVSPRLPNARRHDWEFSSLSCSPLIEGDRAWFTTNRCETMCLNIAPLHRGEGEPSVIWKVDMMKELGVAPCANPMGIQHTCSIAAFGDLIYVITGNGVDEELTNVPAPDAPSLVCFNKNSGAVVWQDNSPAKNILLGQWASPLVIEVDGSGQVIAPLGDGWLRSFDALTGKLIWEFDLNPKDIEWKWDHGTRSFALSSPVLANGLIYIGIGVDPNFGERVGRLCCIDPTKQGDISAELGIDADGHVLPRRRIQAVDATKGEKAIPNPNSGLVWEFTKLGEKFEEQLHTSIANVAVHNGLVIVVDASGLVHCFDAQTGRRYWYYDTLAVGFASPLIVDDKVYVADQDGDVAIFRLAADPDVAMKKTDEGYAPIAEIQTGSSDIMASPIFANGVLYVADGHSLYAISTLKESAKPAGSIAPSSRVRSDASRGTTAIFVPTPQDVVEKMLELANVQKTDVVYDLGSGDGRIVVTAAKKYGCRAIGYEIDAELVNISREKIAKNNIGDLARIEHRDLFAADFADANVIAVYLPSKMLEKLTPQFAKLKPGSRIVSHHFDIPGYRPDKVITVVSDEDGEERKLYLWTMPLRKKD